MSSPASQTTPTPTAPPVDPTAARSGQADTHTPSRSRPLLMSAPMVRATMAGLKTQTRRIVKPWRGVPLPPDRARWFQAADLLPGFWYGYYPESAEPSLIRCPYGVPGDRLVFLCGWATDKKYNHLPPSKLPKSARAWSRFDGTEKPDWAGRTRMGRHMPKWLRASMPKGEVVSVRVERVQDISEADAIAEGLPHQDGDGECWLWEGRGYHGAGFDRHGGMTFHIPGPNGCACNVGGPTPAQCAFRELWHSINGPESWAANPFVWVVEFKRIGGAQ